MDYYIYSCSSFFSESPAKKAYGLLSAWWAALYFSNFMGIALKEIWLYLIVGAACSGYLLLTTPFTHVRVIDILEPLPLLLSPIILNSLFTSLKTIFVRKFVATREKEKSPLS
jgi:ABC-type Fe3+-siderophore transport system permease subunit